MPVAHVLIQDARVAILCVHAPKISLTAGALVWAVEFVASVLALCEAVALLDGVQTEAVEGPALDGSRVAHELVDAAAVVAAVLIRAVLQSGRAVPCFELFEPRNSEHAPSSRAPGRSAGARGCSSSWRRARRWRWRSGRRLASSCGSRVRRSGPDSPDARHTPRTPATTRIVTRSNQLTA